MFVITNREVNRERHDLAALGEKPNPSGPSELRFVEVEKRGGDFHIQVLDEHLSKSELKQLITDYKLDIDGSRDWFVSLRVACELFDKARRENRHILFFVHGYNNDLEDVFKAAVELEANYNVIVVPFSWPANGRFLDYLDDKDDARGSATALHRAVQKIQFYHRIMTDGIRTDNLARARKKHPASAEQANALFMTLMARECRVSINMLCHSMGNYVLKYSIFPGSSSLRDLVFDNIALVAADANNDAHAQWVEALMVRNRLYVVINENDYALAWSRRKPGDEQKSRLGAHLRNLNANNAYYLDVTRNRGVGTDHSYFKGDAIAGNERLKKIFSRIFEGGTVEHSMTYHSDINVYRS